MAYKLQCPSCGAAVEVKNKGSLFVVCPYCSTTSNRKDQDLEAYGKVAELQDDGSPFQLGTTGRYQDRPFEFIGRIQLKLDTGFWNEWHVQYANGESAWLSEAQGNLMFTKEEAVSDIPALESLEPGKEVQVGGKGWEVKEVQSATCVSGEGELPFAFDGGYETNVADLVDAEGNFATLDYADDPPKFYTGATVAFDDLHLNNLRDKEAEQYYSAESDAQNFTCTGCGANLPLRAPGFSKSVACEYCGSVIDVSNPKHEVISKLKKLSESGPRPVVELGHEATFDASGLAEKKAKARKYEFIGFMVRSVNYDGTEYPWQEYLFVSKDKERKYLWLVESNGHWSLIETVNKKITMPTMRFGRRANAKYNGREFRHFSHYQGRVRYVIGEFYWQIHKDDVSTLDDFTSPKYVLGRDKTKKEVNWSIGKYMTDQEVADALGMTASSLPPQKGINICQPNPHEGKGKVMKWWFRILATTGFTLALLFHFGGSSQSLTVPAPGKGYVYNRAQVETKGAQTRANGYGTNKAKRIVRTKPFYLRKGNLLGFLPAKRNLGFQVTLPKSKVQKTKNGWVRFGFELKPLPNKKCKGKGIPNNNKITGKSQKFSWVKFVQGPGEGFSVPSVAHGCYRLEVDPLFHPGITGALWSFKLVYGDSDYTFGGVFSLIWVFILLAIPRFIYFFRRKSFERQRWAESDYGA